MESRDHVIDLCRLGKFYGSGWVWVRWVGIYVYKNSYINNHFFFHATLIFYVLFNLNDSFRFRYPRTKNFVRFIFRNVQI